jgi:drug/metabolite transporter (DMT)-like permease
LGAADGHAEQLSSRRGLRGRCGSHLRHIRTVRKVADGSRLDAHRRGHAPYAGFDAIGVAWALGAAVCAACFFVLSDQVSADGSGLHSVTLAAGGLLVGAAAVAMLGITGVLPLTFTANDATVAGHATSFLVPVGVLAVVSTAMGYALGISGVARLRPSYASLLGLAEVLCAVVAAWVLVGEAVTAVQAVGGLVVLLGLALAARGGDHREAAATWPDVGPAEDLAAAAGR